MGMGTKFVPGVEADLVGDPLPARMLEWLNGLPDDLCSILNRLCTNGHGAWLVGGAVRDAWVGGPNAEVDIDVATTHPPEEVLALFGSDAIDTGSAFGTITVKGHGNHYEITTLRTESLYRDGRRPEQVEWGTSLKEDLSRRDFTFNSMAVDAARALLYDPFDGVIDLENKIVRAVGDPAVRCEEDALRILRAYRFLNREAEELWSMEPNLQRAVISRKERLSMVAVERRWMELVKIMRGNHAGAILSLMKHDGVLAIVWPSSTNVRHELLDALDEPSLHGLQAHHRTAVVMIEQPTSVLLKHLSDMKCSKEFQRGSALFHERLPHLPTNAIADLRVFDHVLGPDAPLHLNVREVLEPLGPFFHGEAHHPAGRPSDVSAAWKAMPSRQTPDDCLIDGHWLMQRTGVSQGIRLGRLKQWLHRMQVEHDFTSVNEMEGMLSRLPFEHGDHEGWPSVSFP